MASSKNDKSSAFKRAEVNLHGKLKGYLPSHTAHHQVPGINLNKTPWLQQWDIANVLSLHEKYPFKSDLPKPLLPPAQIPATVLHNGDPGVDIVYTKQYIQDDIDKVLNDFGRKESIETTLKKDVKWKKKNNMTTTSLPKYLTDLADFIESDPDPTFSGKYNWYYTGGSLNSISFNGRTILLTQYVRQLVAVPISPTEHSIWKPNFKDATKCDAEDTLYEIRHTLAPESCRILARHKYECTLYAITEKDSKLDMILLDCKKTKIPFVSADLSPFDHNQYCTLTTGRSLDFIDMVSGKSISNGILNSAKRLDDNWASVRYQSWNVNVATVTDRCCMHYFDLRLPIENPALSMCPKYKLDDCESISIHIPSHRDSRSYLGTYHSALMLDDRSPQVCIQQKWTHQFKSPPLLGTTLMRSGQEFLVLTSQMIGDTSVILNTWENYDDPHNFSLPYRPRNILDTLSTSQQMGQCLDPLMKTRCRLSNAGSQLLIDDSDDVFLFSQNSIGDIFYQCITHDKTEERLLIINDYATYALKMWEKAMLNRRDVEQKTAPLVLTEEVVASSLARDCMDKTLKYEFTSQRDEQLEYRWQQSVEKLQSYTDLLAPELLAAWDITEDSVPVIQAAPHDKVMNWLEMSSPKYSIESQEIPLSQPFSEINSQDLVSVSQQPKEEIIIEDPEEVFCPPVKIRTKPKEMKKKKSSYVAGF